MSLAGPANESSLHWEWEIIRIHTAKCDDCQKHNTGTCYRCESCSKQLCDNCLEKLRDCSENETIHVLPGTKRQATRGNYPPTASVVTVEAVCKEVSRPKEKKKGNASKAIPAVTKRDGESNVEQTTGEQAEKDNKSCAKKERHSPLLAIDQTGHAFIRTGDANPRDNDESDEDDSPLANKFRKKNDGQRALLGSTESRDHSNTDVNGLRLLSMAINVVDSDTEAGPERDGGHERQILSLAEFKTRKPLKRNHSEMLENNVRKEQAQFGQPPTPNTTVAVSRQPRVENYQGALVETRPTVSTGYAPARPNSVHDATALHPAPNSFPTVGPQLFRSRPQSLVNQSGLHNSVHRRMQAWRLDGPSSGQNLLPDGFQAMNGLRSGEQPFFKVTGFYKKLGVDPVNRETIWGLVWAYEDPLATLETKLSKQTKQEVPMFYHPGPFE